MMWVFLAISAHFCWAVVNVIDKYIVEKWIQNPYLFASILVLIGGGASLFLLVLSPVPLPRGETLVICLIAGLLHFIGLFPFMKALELEEVSRINMWWSMVPLFTLIFGWGFLGESLTLAECLAFALLITGAIVASLKVEKNQFRFSRAFWFMVLASAIFAA